MKKYFRWTYVILGMIIFICLGTVYSWSIFKKPLEKTLSLNATQSNLPFMFFLAFYSILMPFGGRLISKYSPRLVLLIGSILVSLGWILSSYSKTIVTLVLFYGIIAGSGVGIVYGVPIAVIAKWFKDKQGLATGLLLSGFGMSPFVTAPIAVKLIDSYGPFATFRILGFSFLVILIALSLFFKFPNEDTAETKITDYSLTPKEMLKTSKFYVLWICFVIATFVGLMIIGITSPVGEEIIKINHKKIALFVSLFSIFNGLGRPLFGFLCDKSKPIYVINLSYILILTASILLLLFNTGTTFLYLIVFILFWMNFGGWLSIAPYMTNKLFGKKYYSQNYGILFTAYGVGAILGNITSGIAKDTFGSYKFIGYPAILLVITGLVLSNIFLRDK